MSYRVHLDSFHGPLDLLLYLVKKNELDILTIPVSKLADQFTDYLSVMRELDVELAGDFLVMAATLMEIKSRTLVPSRPAGEDEDHGPDPRKELVKQLLAYRAVKDAAAVLEEKAERRAERYARVAPAEPTLQGTPSVRPVELWDLVSAFARIVRETQALEPTTIAVDDTPQHIYEERVREKVKAEGRVNFRDIFPPPYLKVKLIGLFLAILELIKAQEITLEQPEPFGDIWLVIPGPGSTGSVGPSFA